MNENYYELDRMIWRLIHAGYSKHVKAVIVGKLLKCGSKDSKSFGYRRFYESLKELTDGPIWTGARFGHGVTKQRILPIGASVELSSNKVKFLKPVVGR